ncbi:MAG: uroporphyrinogen-III C-methyltransferase [Gammaproteobacteria bacterium]|nr:uroporphyrinogen-III C-methyltransferase [Gammaproteobacteria bacterium]
MSNEIEKNVDSQEVEIKVSKVKKNVNNSEYPVDKKSFFTLKKIALLLFILLIIGLISGECFFYYSFTKSQARVLAIIEQLQTAQQENAVIPLEKNLSSAMQSIQQLQLDVKQLQQSLEQTIQAQSGNKNKLELMHAVYYVKLANDNVQYSNNIPVAISLLKMADQTLHNLSDATYDDARKALASDIAALQSAAKVDVTGLYMRLTALNTQLNQLQLPKKLFATEGSSDTTPDSSNQPWWRHGLQTTWQALQKIVVVRYDEKNAQPFITPEQQLFLYQNLHAMLAEAIWGLLHGQTIIYQSSLQQTAEWIKEYFVTDSSVTQAVLNELNQLQQINIHPDNPPITESLQAFQKIDENTQ